MLVSESSFLKGIAITLYEKTQVITDPFGAPIYDETAVQVDNVLVTPSSEQEIIDTLNLTGRKAIYTLGIPKGDTHDWNNVNVSFFGKTFRTIGMPVEGIDSMIPLEWNKKVRCEVVNGEG